MMMCTLSKEITQGSKSPVFYMDETHIETKLTFSLKLHLKLFFLSSFISYVYIHCYCFLVQIDNYIL